MGQIVRGKKKGRPSKADLDRRSSKSPAIANPNLRRSLRHRTVRNNVISYEDYLIDDEEYEEERRCQKKKLKLVTKLNQAGDEGEEEESRVVHSHHVEVVGDETGRKENGDDLKCGKVDTEGLHCVSGAPPNPPPSGIPLPDKRTLEMILDKLQKKDKYGVFAEPVDTEELPDYHDVIEHPMDFATVRKKLANASYPTLEQFESLNREIAIQKPNSFHLISSGPSDQQHNTVADFLLLHSSLFKDFFLLLHSSLFKD
ncbi:hypothetical protein RIF29_00866 [Crotalaria pallida]|uniref:Bromo domain-containing protein n=1 Tax=Crotalaria pallida TaxID=3830 RepID=A0AAN9P6V3_CROPI